MEIKRGWWTLNAKMFDDSEVSDSSLEHIASLVKEGYTSGEIVEEE